jgi:DNA-binding HxlR family transcriptional regulator
VDGYGQFCPVSLAAEIFARRWTPLIVRELLAGSSRFGELRQGIPNITPSVLSRRLDELAVAGIVERREDGEGGARYVLTDAGESLRPVVEQLGLWGRRWLPSDYREQDLDPRLLVWDIHRNIRVEEIPHRILIELRFRDAQPGRRAYWLVLEPGAADVCLTHPGGEVDLNLTSDVRTLTQVWMGDVGWGQALRGGSLELRGPSDLRRALPAWLKLNPFATAPTGRDPRRRPAAPRR